MRLFLSLLSVLVFIMPEQKVDKALYEGIYTNTGYGYNDRMEPINGKSSSSYYVKIYANKLIKTMSVWGYSQPQDIEYKYIGKNDDNQRIYENNSLFSILVDADYNIIEVFTMPSSRYGNNVKEHTYWRVVKGDKEQEYNQEHQNDGSAYNTYQDQYPNIFDY